MKFQKKKTATALPLKWLSNFWRSLEIPLINCKIELKLKWTNFCVLPAAGNGNEDTKLYAPVVTFCFYQNSK